MPIRLFLFLFLSACPRFLPAQQPGDYGHLDKIRLPTANGDTLVVYRIWYRTIPSSRTILLLHGGGPGALSSFLDTRSYGEPFAGDLAKKGFVVYLMNVRGWENSTAPKYDTTDTSLTAGSCTEAAEDIDTVVDYIRRTERLAKINLFGWATGGHWVAYYTTGHNDKVDHLIVLNTLYGVKGPWSLNKDFSDPADTDRYNVHLPVYRESSQQALKNSRLNAIPFPNKQDWLDTSGLRDYAYVAASWNPRLVLRVPGGYRKESFYMARGHQYWNALNILVPTLILRSQYDFWSRPIDVTAFYNDLANAPRREALELPNATHFVFQEKPAKGRDALLAAIDGFIPK